MYTSSSCLLFLLACLSLYYLTNASNSTIQCIKHEREALLEFKEGIEVDNCGLLSSWGDHHQPDCCTWRGIRCSHQSSHVITLDLHGVNPNVGCLQGKVGPSLLELKDLAYLDLSCNDFQGQSIPTFIGSLSNLQYLNLSTTNFQGEVPPHLGNLTKLVSLDLSLNLRGFSNFCSSQCQYVKALEWLSYLTFLRVIDLSMIDLSNAADWLQVVNNLPFLRVLRMDGCGLRSPTIVSLISYVNSTTTLGILSMSINHINDTSIFQWLFNLSGTATHLVHVDLSDNSIPGPVPSYFFSMHSLSYLDLSSNDLEGPIPSAFGNMHSLSYLDLSSNDLEGPIPSAIGNMHSLSYLDLSSNQLEGRIPSALGNLHSLLELHLSGSHLKGRIPDTIWNLNHLTFLDLSSNYLQWTAPPKNVAGGAGLCSLQMLDISSNNLTADLSSIIQSLSTCAYSKLEYLHLEDNRLQGPVPTMITMFSLLIELDLSGNMLQGTLSESHFSNLSRLKSLNLEDNLALVLNASAEWIPPFQLDEIYLSSCMLGPSFPMWLLTQTNFTSLYLSNTGISDSIPASFWHSLPPSFVYLNLSKNKIYGTLPNFSTNFYKSPSIDVSSNCLEGAIPLFSRNFSEILLSNNKFSNFFAPFLCPRTKTKLFKLDLSNNFLSGKLPDCWMNFDQLLYLDLGSNNFTGVLPTSIGTLQLLFVLNLHNNSFHGELHMSLENITNLYVLDISHNLLTGYIPPGIGSLGNIFYLNLRSNYLEGKLPLSLCQLSVLQILDLSANNLSGTIPECIHNLQAMSSDSVVDFVGGEAVVMWKRKEQSYRTTLGLVISIAISDNKLDGQIPNSISSLKGLVSLDLARNNLTGSIPSNIGELTALQLLDLSSNHLSGGIPASLANVAYLGTLNLSNNNLSGKIPRGTATQLQGFDPSTYSGNRLLCGPPLPDCHEDQAPNIPQKEENDNDEIFPGLYISVVLGFITGFWVVCGSLVLKRSWRHACFRFFDDVKDRLYVMFAVNIARVWRRKRDVDQ